MLQLTLPSSRDGTLPLFTNTQTDIHRSSNNWTQMISPSCTFKSIPNSQETRTRWTTHRVFTWLSRKRTKSHIQSMQITCQASRDIRSAHILASSCLNRSMEITSSTCTFKIQDPLTHSRKSLELFNSTSTRAPPRQEIQVSEMTTSSLTKSQITSHRKKPKKELWFQSFSQQLSQASSSTLSRKFMLNKQTFQTWRSGEWSLQPITFWFLIIVAFWIKVNLVNTLWILLAVSPFTIFVMNKGLTPENCHISGFQRPLKSKAHWCN